MLSKKHKGSIVYRVTLWYSVFIVIFFALMLGVAYVIGVNLGDSKGQQKLQHSALELGQEIEDYENFDDGIYYVIYNKNDQRIRGSLPRGFDTKLGFTDEQLKEATNGNITYQYFDVKIKDSTEWLRAIRVKAGLSHELKMFLLALFLVAPFLVVGIVFGGYRILKKAIAPVDNLTQTARAITLSQDYSKRIIVSEQNNELSRLALTFNTMLASIERSFERERQFNNDVSHELRTPLAVILAESEYADKYAKDEAELKESAQIIRQQATMMKNLVDQILELTRLENGQTFKKNQLDLAQLVQERVTAQQKIFEQRGLKLICEITEHQPYLGDELLLQRVVDNLLSNALKFAKTRVKVSLTNNGHEHLLTIKDDGPGIALDQQEKIWHKFYQVQTARNKTSTQGVGLGLALVKNIVELHGGQITVKSQLKKGTEFRLYLPNNISEGEMR